MVDLLFYYFVYLKVNLDQEKTIKLGESSSNFIFAAVNLNPIVIEKLKTVVEEVLNLHNTTFEK